MAARPQLLLYDTTGQHLPRNEQQTYVAGFTDLAKKYSHPIGQFADADHRIINNTCRSGITPISSPPPGIIEDAAQKQTRKDFETYQRTRFRGFTTAELQEPKALEPLDLEEKNNTLVNGIHPVFEQAHWITEDELPKHIGAIPILGDYKGFWEARNPDIWKILYPCLQLATMILRNEYQYAWLDTLLEGTFEEIGTHNGKPLRRFVPRTEAQKRNAPLYDKVKDLYETKLLDMVDFRFVSGYEHPEFNLPNRTTTRNGLTSESPLYPRIHVKLTLERYHSLLRKDLTDKEK